MNKCILTGDMNAPSGRACAGSAFQAAECLDWPKGNAPTHCPRREIPPQDHRTVVESRPSAGTTGRPGIRNPPGRERPVPGNPAASPS